MQILSHHITELAAKEGGGGVVLDPQVGLVIQDLVEEANYLEMV
jgi:hypothetical protein